MATRRTPEETAEYHRAHRGELLAVWAIRTPHPLGRVMVMGDPTLVMGDDTRCYVGIVDGIGAVGSVVHAQDLERPYALIPTRMRGKATPQTFATVGQALEALDKIVAAEAADVAASREGEDRLG